MKENLIYTKTGSYAAAMDEYDVKFYKLNVEMTNTST
ncbi:unnamed protein product, partial [marine sediment metagenome]